MVDYYKLSDFEINKLVMDELRTDGFDDLGENLTHISCDGDVVVEPSPDYCNNPADAWRVIVENKVMLSPHCADDEWKAQVYLGREGIFDNYASAWHKNPLRAAMIVFLMMQEEKHG